MLWISWWCCFSFIVSEMQWSVDRWSWLFSLIMLICRQRKLHEIVTSGTQEQSANIHIPQMFLKLCGTLTSQIRVKHFIFTWNAGMILFCLCYFILLCLSQLTDSLYNWKDLIWKHRIKTLFICWITSTFMSYFENDLNVLCLCCPLAKCVLPSITLSKRFSLHFVITPGFFQFIYHAGRNLVEHSYMACQSESFTALIHWLYPDSWTCLHMKEQVQFQINTSILD